MFKLIAIIALLVVASHAGKVSIHSSGAYVARCTCDVRDAHGTIKLASGNIYAGQTRDIQIPDNVEWMNIRCENQRLVGKWYEVFTQESNGPRSLCYSIGGTTFHPNHSAKFC
ncbi:unnamed protein product [Adineta steineri]|uniref:Uncharacterized protein n=1 Tax=Adineta steineri TaxID=433720 RepID=A0A814DX76_9BILA|nr:unnamed protein product [Adineta steineri]CAF3852762.1 unnamed protein product [Adineta steineri]